ncbi:MAG: hypothetical protein O2783_00015 [Chloroflexi bacterium]|nr:hypothetical protein [Chloroflexota bacterium]
MAKQTRGKSIPAKQRKEWLDAVESGQTTMSEIAKTTGRNIRTIQNQVGMASEQRDLSLARVDMFRSAVSKHQAGLLNAVSMLRGRLRVPPMDRFTDLLAIPADSSRAQLIENAIRGGIAFDVGSEEISDSDRMNEFLREHLRKDRRFWGDVDIWLSDLLSYAELCTDLGATAANRSARSSEFPVTDGNGNTTGLHRLFVTWVCRIAIESETSQALEDRLQDLRMSETQLHFGGSTVATGSSEDDLQRARTAFVKVAKGLMLRDEVRRIRELRRKLEQNSIPLRRTLGDIVLLGIVMGSCSQCRQLGMV